VRVRILLNAAWVGVDKASGKAVAARQDAEVPTNLAVQVLGDEQAVQEGHEALVLRHPEQTRRTGAELKAQPWSRAAPRKTNSELVGLMQLPPTRHPNPRREVLLVEDQSNPPSPAIAFPADPAHGLSEITERVRCLPNNLVRQLGNVRCGENNGGGHDHLAIGNSSVDVGHAVTPSDRKDVPIGDDVLVMPPLLDHGADETFDGVGLGLVLHKNEKPGVR
jgi:hypothetical protein